MIDEDLTCSVCSVARASAQLQKCTTCRRAFCGDCAVRARGGQFCSKDCAEFAYFGDDDDEPSATTDEID